MVDYRFLRRLFGSDDSRAAFDAEQRLVSDATQLSSVEAPLREHLERRRRGPSPFALGVSAVDPNIPVFGSVQEDLAAGRHSLVLGASGAGKTTAVLLSIRASLETWLREPGSAPRLVVQAPNGDLIPRTQQLLREMVATNPRARVQPLLDALVVVNPFSTEALVPLQVLVPIPGVEPEVQAYEFVTVLNRLGGAELGVLQDDWAFHLALLGVTTGRSVPVLAELLLDPEALVCAAASCPHPAVRSFFCTPRRGAGGPSLEGLRARFHRLLRLPSTRAMLGASSCINFRTLLRDHVTLINLCGPPLGCEDLVRFWSALLGLRITRAVFERTPAEAARPAVLFVDEWAEGLGAGADVAEQYERLLQTARARGVSLHLISQSLDRAKRASPALPGVVLTNTAMRWIFRPGPEDAHLLHEVVPVTGREPRARVAPWETPPRDPFMSADEERRMLVQRLGSLPDRHFYYLDRRVGARALLVRSADFNVVEPALLERSVVQRIEHGTLAVPIRELRSAQERIAPNVFRRVERMPVARAPTTTPAPTTTTTPEQSPPTTTARRPRRRPRRED